MVQSVNIVQRRLRKKAEARRKRAEAIKNVSDQNSFNKVLRTWLVKARHNRACSQNHELLLKVQADWAKGVISQNQIQERVRNIVVETEKIPEIVKPDPSQCFYVRTLSPGRNWSYLSTRYGIYVEIIKFPEESDQLEAVDNSVNKRIIAYYLVFSDWHEASRFHYGLIERMKIPNGMENINPISGCDNLENAEIVTWEDAGLSLKSRLDDIVRNQQFVLEKLEKSVILIQSKLRKIMHKQVLDAFLDDFAKVPRNEQQLKTKKKKKKKKKKIQAQMVHKVSEAEPEPSACNDTETMPSKQTSQKEPESSNLLINRELNGDETNYNGTTDPEKLLGDYEMLKTKENITGKYFRLPASQIKLHMVRPAVYQLSAEMYDLLRGLNNLVKLNEDSKRFILTKIEVVLRTVFPCAKLHVFGSYASNLELPSSDIDCFYFHNGGEAAFMNCEEMNVASVKGGKTKGKHRHFSRSGGPHCSMYLPVVQQLEFLRRELWCQPWVKRVTLVHSAMPVLRLEVCAYAVDVDAEDRSKSHLCGKCFTMDLSCGHTPGHTSFASVEFLQAYSKRFRQFRGLTIILKQLLYDRGLSDPFRGGLGSFPLSLLVIAFLKHKSNISEIKEEPAPIEETNEISSNNSVDNSTSYARKKRNKYTDPLYEDGWNGASRHVRTSPNTAALRHARQSKRGAVPLYNKLCYSGLWNDHKFGPLFLEFLDFYGNKFDPTVTGISVRADECQYFQIPPNAYPPTPIFIDNPFWPGQNLASGSYSISAVLQTFRECHAVLQNALVGYEKDGNPSSVLRGIFSFKWGHASKRMLQKKLAQVSMQQAS